MPTRSHESTLPDALASLLRERVGALANLRPTSGGSIAAAYFAELAGRPVFLKTHPSLPAAAFAREREGLEWLAATRTVAVPEVIAASADDDPVGFLLLERVAIAPRGSVDADERFGRALAELHRCPAPLGLSGASGPRDNFLATLPQPNAPAPSWAHFYAERRLLPLAARASSRGLFPSALARKLDKLIDGLERRVGPDEPSAHLHGDLWGGNRVVAASGESYLIDPAVYGGHREIDLAMMQLFGGFSARVFAAYDEVYDRARGHEERVALYQLYPLLAHLVMFGAGYAGEVEAALDASLKLG